MSACRTDRCRQGRAACPTPNECDLLDIVADTQDEYDDVRDVLGHRQPIAAGALMWPIAMSVVVLIAFSAYVLSI